jgi:hypothetical protein
MNGLNVTEAVMAAEMPAITAWADRHGWEITYDPTTLKGRVLLAHPKLPGHPVTFNFDATGYPDRQPPAWWCGETGNAPTEYPRPTATPRLGMPDGSIFHGKPCICAPWNRLAYGIHGGPHPDWAMSSWKTAGDGYTQAHTIADMLSSLYLHLAASDGMQSEA